MNAQKKFVNKNPAVAALSFAFILGIFILAHDAYGQAMSSSNFKIQSDSVNFGGVRSGSGSFTIEDTLGETATGISSSTNYIMKAGYQQMQDVTIAVIPAGNVTLSPSIAGLTGGTSNGSTNFVVTTDDPAGYTATIIASSSVGMLGNRDSANSIPALVPATPTVPDFAFEYASVAPNKAYFGYTVEASTTADTAALFKDDGVNCNTGSGNIEDKCWLNASTTAVTIMNRTSRTDPTGATTTLKFRVVMQANPNPIIPDDTYNATTTVTVIPL